MSNTKRPFPSLILSLGVAALITVPASMAQDANPPAEVFQAGEALRVRVWADSNSFLNGAYPIAADGMADLPVAGRILVAGKTRANTEKYLAGIWAPYMRDTQIAVTPAIRVAILGNVRNPGYFYFHPDTKLFDAIHEAGSPTVPEKITEMQLLRGRDVIREDLADDISKGRTLRDADIRSGDHIVIPIPPPRISNREFTKDLLQISASIMTMVVQAITIYYLTTDKSH